MRNVLFLAEAPSEGFAEQVGSLAIVLSPPGLYIATEEAWVHVAETLPEEE